MQVTVSGLVKKFGETVAVDHMDVVFKDGKLTGLLGPSGCGKSTTLYMISGLENVSEGKILFGDRDVTTLMPEKRNIGLVFQNYALYPHMTVKDNIIFPLTNLLDPETGRKYSKEKRESSAREISELVQIGELMDRKPSQLSGGQQQRVAIARALIKKPDVLLLDEPLSNLDARLRMEMRAEIRRIQRESRVTTIFVTHDQEEAMSITDEIVLMRKGIIQQIAEPHDMYLNPANTFVASFMGNPPISYIDVDVRDGKIKAGDTLIPCDTSSGTYEGKAKLGIRPEAWGTGGEIQAVLEEVELRGQDQVITFHYCGAKIKAVLNAEEDVYPGKYIGLRLIGRRCYLFDAEGNRI